MNPATTQWHAWQMEHYGDVLPPIAKDYTLAEFFSHMAEYSKRRAKYSKRDPMGTLYDMVEPASFTTQRETEQWWGTDKGGYGG